MEFFAENQCNLVCFERKIQSKSEIKSFPRFNLLHIGWYNERFVNKYASLSFGWTDPWRHSSAPRKRIPPGELSGRTLLCSLISNVPGGASELEENLQQGITMLLLHNDAALCAFRRCNFPFPSVRCAREARDRWPDEAGVGGRRHHSDLHDSGQQARCRPALVQKWKGGERYATLVPAFTCASLLWVHVIIGHVISALLVDSFLN